MKTTKGGKAMNPTDSYRKELRRKELKRNKKERRKVREVGILKKDPDSLRDQIHKLEQMKAEGALDKTRRHKKRQLEDTLNLVLKKRKELEEKAKEAGEEPIMFSHLIAPRRSSSEAVRNPRPEDSVYYHPSLNPSGQPPPGKPPMFRPSTLPKSTVGTAEGSQPEQDSLPSTSESASPLPLPPLPPPPPLPLGASVSALPLPVPVPPPPPAPPGPPSWPTSHHSLPQSLPPPPHANEDAMVPPGEEAEGEDSEDESTSQSGSEDVDEGEEGEEGEEEDEAGEGEHDAPPGVAPQEWQVAEKPSLPPPPPPPPLLPINGVPSSSSTSPSPTIPPPPPRRPPPPPPRPTGLPPPPPARPPPPTPPLGRPPFMHSIPGPPPREGPPSAPMGMRPPPGPPPLPLSSQSRSDGSSFVPPGMAPPPGPPPRTGLPPPLSHPNTHPGPPGMRPPPGPPPGAPSSASGNVIGGDGKPSYIKVAAPTVVKRPLAHHIPELTAMVPASVRVRREIASKAKPKVVAPTPASVGTKSSLSGVKPASLDESYSAFLEDLKDLGAFDEG